MSLRYGIPLLNEGNNVENRSSVLLPQTKYRAKLERYKRKSRQSKVEQTSKTECYPIASIILKASI